MKGNKLFIPVFLVFAGLLTASAAASADAEELDDLTPAEIVRRANVVRWERPVHFREMRTMVQEGSSETVLRRIWWHPPARLKLEEEHDHGQRLFLWTDSEQWFYDSRFPYVLHIEGRRPTIPLGAPHGFGAPHPFPKDEWSKSEGAGPGGRPARVIERRWPGGSSRWWIDGEHFFPWKEEHFGLDAGAAAVIVRSDVEFDPDFPDELFQFELPDDVEVVSNWREWRRQTIVHGVRAGAPFAVAVPLHVPEGYVLVDGGIVSVNGKPAVHWRFYDGQHLLSVFQLPEEGGRPPRREPALGVTVHDEVVVVTTVWQGHRFFVVGYVTTEEAREIFESLQSVDD